MANVFTAKAHGLMLAVVYILKENMPYSVIYTDSLGALKVLNSLISPKNFLAEELRNEIFSTSMMFCWGPSHVGIAGKGEAHRVASTCCNRTIEIDALPNRNYRLVPKHTPKTNGRINGSHS